MTAVAIRQLRDPGKLSLDDSAVRYAPELGQVHDEFGSIDAVTIRDLPTQLPGPIKDVPQLIILDPLLELSSLSRWPFQSSLRNY